MKTLPTISKLITMSLSKVKAPLMIFLFTLIFINPPIFAQGVGTLQREFDPLPTTLPAPLTYTASSGRIVNYGVIGPVGGQPVLFINGAPSNWSSVDLLAPYKPLLNYLNLRFIQPERVGYGVTPYIDNMTPEKYTDDWADLMNSLGYQTYSIFAASSGGPYADYFMKKYWPKVRSLHLSSAVDTSGIRNYCLVINDPLMFQPIFDFIFQDPSQIWNFFPERDGQTIDSINSARDWFTLSTAATPNAKGLSLDLWMECRFPVGDLSRVQTPVYIYHGLIDQTVPIAMAENHAAAYPNVIRFRTYPKDAHLSSLRHFGQTLLDISDPNNPRRIIGLRKGNAKGHVTLIVSDAVADQLITTGQAIEDICAWIGTPGE